MFRQTLQFAFHGFAFAGLLTATAFAGGHCGGYAAPVYGSYAAPGYSCHSRPAFGLNQQDPLFGLPKAVIGQPVSLPGLIGGRPGGAFLLVNGKFHPCQLTAAPTGGFVASIPDCGITGPTLGQLLLTDANGRLTNQFELNVNPATPAPAAPAPGAVPGPGGQPGAPAAAPVPSTGPIPAAAPGLLSNGNAAPPAAVPPAAPPVGGNAVSQVSPNVSESIAPASN